MKYIIGEVVGKRVKILAINNKEYVGKVIQVDLNANDIVIEVSKEEDLILINLKNIRTMKEV